MQEGEALRRKLVVDGHLNVADRRILGPVTLGEIREIVKSFLIQDAVFPKRSQSGAVYEGATLALVSEGVAITWRRSYAWDPFAGAQQRTQRFTDLDAAIDAFIQSEWSSGIDGIKLERGD